MTIEIRVQNADFSIAEEWQALRERCDGRIGAMASFVGLVRDRAQDCAVTGLYLEHYPGMTEQSIATIVAEAQTRWELDDVVVIHRVGRLTPTEQIVFVQVAAGHRASAFAGCQFIMDYLKTAAVLWKREESNDAQKWLEASDHDRQRIDQWREEES